MWRLKVHLASVAMTLSLFPSASAARPPLLSSTSSPQATKLDGATTGVLQMPPGWNLEKVEGWYITTSPDLCLMEREFPDGTELSFTLKYLLFRDRSRKGFSLAARNPNWLGIHAYDFYDVDVRIGALAATLTGMGSYVNGKPGVLVSFKDPAEALNAVRTSGVVSLLYKGRPLGTFSLSGAAAAATALEKCLTGLPNDPDPFSG